MPVKTFRDLITWQKAMLLARETYLLTKQLPGAEQFGLTAQMRKAAISIPSNIAEGHGRESRSDYLRFLRTARGSLMELQTQFILAADLQLLTMPPHAQELLAETDRVLQALIRSLKKLQN